MPRYLFANPFLHPPGGGEGVANWMIQVLAQRGEVTVLTWDPPDFEEIDRYYGTELSRVPLRLMPVAPTAQRMLKRFGIPHYLLKIHWLERRARQLRHRYDFCFSAFNELDFGPEPAVQYVHHPTGRLDDGPSPTCPSGHPLARLLWPLYLGGLRYFCPYSLEHIRANITLVNSRWTGRAYHHFRQGPVHGVLYPPPLGQARARQDAPRAEGFISVGRVDRNKNWPLLIEIIEGVRRRGHDVSLTLAGSGYDEGLLRELQSQAAQHSHWLTLALNQPRERLDDLIAGHRYAIHGMRDEHYGMAVAELVLSGCLVFVHDSGGQVEIVRTEDTRYQDVTDAVEKIDRVLSDNKLRDTLIARQAENRANITRDKFIQEFHQFLDRLEAGESFQGLEL